MSSKNRPGSHLLDDCVSTRNRKVEGSNPSSGSKAAAHRRFPALLTAQRQEAVIPLGWISRRRRARHGASPLPQAPNETTGKPPGSEWDAVSLARSASMRPVRFACLGS